MRVLPAVIAAGVLVASCSGDDAATQTATESASSRTTTESPLVTLPPPPPSTVATTSTATSTTPPSTTRTSTAEPTDAAPVDDPPATSPVPEELDTPLRSIDSPMVDWAGDWIVDVRWIFGSSGFPLGQMLASTDGGATWWITVGLDSALWTPATGELFDTTGLFAPITARDAPVLTARIDPLAADFVIANVDTFELFELDSTPVAVSADGALVLVAGDAEPAPTSWADGTTTSFRSIGDLRAPDQPGVPTPIGRQPGEEVIAFSPEADAILLPPDRDDDFRRPHQLEIRRLDDNPVVVLGLDDPVFTGGANFSADGQTALVGTGEGLRLVDAATGDPVAPPMNCATEATWLRAASDAVEVEPGTWLVALSASSARRAERIVALVDPIAQTCDFVVRNGSAPERDVDADPFFQSILGAAGSSTFFLFVQDFSSDELLPVMLVDLDRRPDGAVLMIQGRQWTFEASG